MEKLRKHLATKNNELRKEDTQKNIIDQKHNHYSRFPLKDTSYCAKPSREQQGSYKSISTNSVATVDRLHLWDKMTTSRQINLPDWIIK